ncbi:MAG TPA: MFS transporter [Opitutaceae bacterium]|nr:MFS transporter [Opitutaceae bacterium]
MTPARAALLLLPVIYLGFISLGLPDGSLGVAWPRMHRDLGLPIGLAGLIVAVGTVLSAAAAFSSGKIIARFKTGPVVLVSCALTGSAMLIVSQAQGLSWLLVAAVPIGLGAGAVDASLNGYVARHYRGRHMNWLHACWGIGAMCGPLVMARLLGTPSGWRVGYFAIGTAQLALAAIFLCTLRLWDKVPERTTADSDGAGASQPPAASANSPAGWLSAAIFVIYVAVETTAGLWAGSILVVSRGIAQESAAICVAAYYGSITGGRIFFGWVVERWGNRRLINVGTSLALLGTVVFAFAHTSTLAALGLVLLGLGFAPVYPCLMHEVPKRFAPEAVQTVIGRQSGAAAIGASSLPAAAGWLAGVSLESIAWILIAGVVGLIAAIRRLNRIT